MATTRTTLPSALMAKNRAERAPVDAGVWLRATVAVAARPRLWRTAVRQWHRSVPSRWWATAPFLPLPSRRYVEFRVETAYGRASPRPADLVDYLDWCRRQRVRTQRR
jgi:hypothetical protein